MAEQKHEVEERKETRINAAAASIYFFRTHHRPQGQKNSKEQNNKIESVNTHIKRAMMILHASFLSVNWRVPWNHEKMR